MNREYLMTFLIVILFITAGIGYWFFIRRSLSLWVRALIAGAKVSLLYIAFLQLQNIREDVIESIVTAIIKASKAGVFIDTKDLSVHLLAGGDVNRVIEAMILAHKAKIPLTFKTASAIDLAGRNVLDAVNMTISPVIVETPEVAGLSKSGIQLKIRCRVTVKANVNNFIGGAGKATILARVGTGIVSAVGSAVSHQTIVGDPSIISRHIMSIDRDKDSVSDIHQDTAYKVISIDVIQITVGDDVGARLDALRSQAKQKIAHAKAEAERAETVTREKEFQAKKYEMKAKKIEAEASALAAIAEALRSGKLSVKDYLKMKNIEADTRMRQAFVNSGKPPYPPLPLPPYQEAEENDKPP